MKTGRNHPCPCGSGKKYKFCHGAAAGRDPLTSSASSSSRPATLSLEHTGLPGLPGLPEHLIAVAQPLDPRQRRPDHPAGLPGRYEVTFLFSRATTAIPEREITFEPNFE